MREQTRKLTVMGPPCNPGPSNRPLQAPSEEQVDRYGPRVGMPRLPPHPPRFEGLRAGEHPPGWSPDHIRHASRTCLDLGIHYQDISLSYRSAQYDPRVKKEICLVVYSSFRDIRKWPGLCRSLFSYLRQNDMLIPVEIIDWEASANALDFPLLSARSDMVPLWPKIKPQVLEILAGQRWYTMTVYGSASDRCAPVVVLRVWNPRDPIWLVDHTSSVASKVLDVCNSHGIRTKLVVAQAYSIWPIDAGNVPRDREGDSKIEDCAGFPANSTLPTEHFMRLIPGAGLELQDKFPSVGAGTFGGHFELKGGSETVEVGLTCYHAVRHPELVAEGTDKNGLHLSSEFSDVFGLQSPKSRDYQACLLESATAIRNCKKEIRTANEQLSYNPENIGAQRSLETFVAHLATYKDRMTRIRDSDRRAGQVIAAGGLRLHREGWPLDWALVRTPPARRARNMVPFSVIQGLSKEVQLFDPRLEDTELGMEVSKIGSKTGHTCGQVNALKVDINLKDPAGPCTGWVVKTPHGGPIFAEPGDSGALVWDSRYAWCGVLFGANPGEMCGLYVPAEVVLEDVEALTQGKLVLPDPSSGRNASDRTVCL